ncbi:MAG: hypothetical protein NC355_10595 [Blautia sp.]|nr:hypothetical protein [Blautia sp.]
MSYSIGDLFQSSSSGSSGFGGNFFSDYASIKNGSYRRLVKSYYGKTQSNTTTGSSGKAGTGGVLEKLLEEKKNPTVSEEVQEANSKLTTGLSSLSTSVAALQNEKTYMDTENGSTAKDKVIAAVKEYVSNYNDVITSSKSSTLTSKTAYVANMMSSTAANSDKLAELGIQVNSNGTLTLNESALKEADISKVQEMFSKDNYMSYGSSVASRIHFASVGSSATSSTDSTTETDSDTETDSSTVTAGASGLKDAATTLSSDKLYAMIKDEDGNEVYDIDKIFSAAKSFVNNYNTMFDKAKSSSNSGVVANLSYIREKTAKYEESLRQFGISVDSQGKLGISADTFKKSDMAEVQKLFKDYGSSIASSASLVDFYLTTQAGASNSYTSDGLYNVQGGTRYVNSV